MRDDLEIRGEENSGLYGKVFHGHDRQLGRDVAVKIIKPEWRNAADAVKHAKALAGLSHQNIVTVYGVENVDIPTIGNDIPAIIMEWLNGETLGVRLGKAKFKLAEAERICVGIIDGIAHMHERQVAHGDLHVGNVILLPNFMPKIIDIDANKDVTLARLTTISRVAAIQADVEYCRRITVSIIQHAEVRPSLVNDFEAQLLPIENLPAIRLCVADVFQEASEDDKEIDNHPDVFSTHSVSIAQSVQDLIEDGKPVRLRRLVMDRLRHVCNELMSNDFSLNETVTPENYRSRVYRYDELLKELARIISTGCYWSNATSLPLWLDCIQSVANIYEDKPLEGGWDMWVQLRRYPPLVLLYAAGLGAFLNSRFHTLIQLLSNAQFRDLHGRERLAYKLLLWKAREKDDWNKHMTEQNRSLPAPISHHLEQQMHEVFRDEFVGINAFQIQFDRFEYFIGLFESSKNEPTSFGPGQVYSWGPFGSFIYRTRRRPEGPAEFFLEEIETHGTKWAPLEAGLFDGNVDSAKKGITDFEKYLAHVRLQIGIW
jgi:hypothetical protein